MGTLQSCGLAVLPADFSLPPLQACRDFLDLAETHSRKWQRALQYEREQRIRLEETIEQLAKQHNSLERACRGAPGSTGSAGTTKGEPRGWGWEEAQAVLSVPMLLAFREFMVIPNGPAAPCLGTGTPGPWLACAVSNPIPANRARLRLWCLEETQGPQMLLTSQLQCCSCPNWDSFAACKSYLSDSKIKWLWIAVPNLLPCRRNLLQPGGPKLHVQLCLILNECMDLSEK